jgi:predicted solute-binding protein
MVSQYDVFLNNESWRNQVIKRTSEKLGFTESRISEYFSVEVQNKLDDFSKQGLEFFLKEVCGMEKEITWLPSYE